jgi:hypothetical protein
MTFPKENEKAKLELTGSRVGLSIRGRKEQVEELAALFTQHGIGCRTEVGAVPGEGALVFDHGTDPARVEELLESYQHAKGS